MAELGEIYSMNLGEDDDITPKDGYPTRRKYCVIIGKPDYGYYVAYLIIDHEINEKFNPTRELKDCFFPLSMKDYPEIIIEKYDPSWLDMSKIREMETTRLENEGELKCKLTDSDFKLVMQCLKESEVITTKMKKRCGLIPE